MNIEDNGSNSSIAWHPGFCAAIDYELRDYRSELTYTEEYPLSSQPLRPDLLIIKKDPETVIDNDIGRIFKTHNIIEFKNPTDSLSIDDFAKFMGYAWLYKSLCSVTDGIPLKEITVTMLRAVKPVKLLKMLADEYNVESYVPGIYQVRGFTFPCQIIVTQELAKGHTVLKVMSNNASEEEMKTFIRCRTEATEKQDTIDLDAVAAVTLEANAILIEKMKGDNTMSATFMKIFKDEIEEVKNKAVSEAVAEARAEAIAEKDNALAEKDNTIAEKDNTIAIITANFNQLAKSYESLQAEIAAMRQQFAAMQAS